MSRWPRTAARCLLALGLASGSLLAAQYFGQNKVRHKTLHFQVLKTEHFDIYFYPEERPAAAEVGRMAERWYARLTQVLHFVLTTRQPLILYASHTDFEQSTAVPGLISEGMGGVTLSTGRKVVLPLAGPLKETDHVLGHELVHAYQYDMTASRSGVPGVARLPLWFVEGLAEYLSMGPRDPHTSMWLRDAVARGVMPTLKTINNTNRYFPYRFGQAFWAYVGGRFGDDKIAPLLLAAGQSGSVDSAIQRVLHLEPAAFSAAWKQATLAADQPVLAATSPLPRAQVLVASSRRGGRINVSPAVSPDGHWVMFYSERGLFSIDLYLADARTGQVVRKITQTAIDPHFNNLEFINSVGAWAHDGRRFAFGHVRSGQARISIYDRQAQRVVRSYAIPKVGEVFNPTWSPDARQIAFTAIAGGLTNLYLLDTSTGAVRALTHDDYAELQPAWSPDGRSIALVTDRFTSQLADLDFGRYRLALLDPSTGALREVATGLAGNQTNPQWGPRGDSLYFLSDDSGIANIYRLDRATAQVSPVTNLQTGVTGITALSPAFSVAAQSGALVYSAFSDNRYDLVRLPPPAPALPQRAAAPVAALHPALLPPRASDSGAVADYLARPAAGLVPAANFATEPYRARLALDYVAPPSVSVGVSPYGTLLGGGTALYFSDLLGYQNLAVAFEALTTTGGADFYRNLSAQALYTNETHRWTWGLGGGQTPYVSGSITRAATLIGGVPVVQDHINTFWEMDRQVVGLLAYPFSRAQRLEFTAGYSNIGFAAETRTQTYDFASGLLLADQRQSLAAPPSLNFAVGSAALVYDTSIFGGASPVFGQSYRLQAGFNAGSLNFATALADYRRYLSLARPLSLAGRVLTYGRYGAGADDLRLQALYLGYPSLVRGYDFNSIGVDECGPQFAATGACPIFDRLVGSKIAAVNAELRLELFGPLGLVPSGGVPPVELAPFFDAGAAWTSADKPDFLGGNRRPVSSEGLTLRINVFGFAVAAIDYAIPNQRPARSHVWEFSLLPGY
ncbi:MAG TPA: BamA/TamA family outer membrane protein [Terriglobales bacterium]|nr:BamA/TamA family outer membrane protein [Terriglobales bacterium]